MAGQTRIDGNLIDTGTDPNDIVSVSVGDGRYPRLSQDNTLAGNLTVDGDLNLVATGTGTGVFTIAAPDSNTNRTLTLPDEVGKFLTDSGALNVDPSAPTQSAIIDSSGNLLVGKTSASKDTIGAELKPDGRINATMSSGSPLLANRQTSDGDIATFQQGGSLVGSIGNNQTNPYFVKINGGLRIEDSRTNPCDGNGDGKDNSYDLGRSNIRFNDIFAGNGTIQTSDVNEKQDVEELSDAEARVAAKAKTLLRKYRWKSAVEEKGDEARIHFGIIAQDLEQAFIDEGLDAGRYGMFIRGEWYEAEVEKTRTVENDDGTKTTETYMATETYDSAEEAPADAVHKERLGVRYHELLAFIIAAI